MNRRDFIKTVPAAAALPIALGDNNSPEECEHRGHEGETGETGWKRWDYRVYCYEREQGEWLFSQNIKGSFAYQREYVTFEEEDMSPYCGWMDGGKLHFASLEDAEDFVDCHVRTKDDINIVDSIYDVYYISRELPVYDDAENIVKEGRETEIKVAHYWFNGDTGRQIHWVSKKPYTDWTKVECS